MSILVKKDDEIFKTVTKYENERRYIYNKDDIPRSPPRAHTFVTCGEKIITFFVLNRVTMLWRPRFAGHPEFSTQTDQVFLQTSNSNLLVATKTPFHSPFSCLFASKLCGHFGSQFWVPNLNHDL